MTDHNKWAPHCHLLDERGGLFHLQIDLPSKLYNLIFRYAIDISHCGNKYYVSYIFLDGPTPPPTNNNEHLNVNAFVIIIKGATTS